MPRRPNRSEGRGDVRRGRDKPRRPNYRARLDRPGQRATIPDEVLRRLSPDLYRKRTRQRELASPFIEGSPLSLRDVLRERRAAEQLEFGPVESELQRALGAEQTRAQTQTQNIGNWFAQYKADLERAKGAAVQPFQSGMADVQARAGASQTASDESLKALTAQMQADAASRGQTFSGTPAVDAAQAEASRRNLADAMTALLQSQGAATGGYFEASKGVAGSAQTSEFLREQAQHTGALKDLESRRGEIAREKGAFRTDYLGKRRDEERTSVLENKAFGLDVAKVEQDAADDAADRRNQRRTEGQRTNQWGYTNAEWRKMSPAKRQSIIRKQKASGRSGPDLGKVNQYGITERRWRGMSQSERQKVIRESKSKGRGGTDDEGLSPAERRQRQTRVEGVRQKTGEFAEDVGLVRARRPGPEDRTNLITGRNSYNRKFHPVVVDAGIELNRRGYVSDRTIQRMHRLGLRVPRSWIRKPNQGAEGHGRTRNPGAGK